MKIEEKKSFIILIICLIAIVLLIVFVYYINGEYHCRRYCNESFKYKATRGYWYPKRMWFKCENHTAFINYDDYDYDYDYDEDGWGERIITKQCLERSEK